MDIDEEDDPDSDAGSDCDPHPLLQSAMDAAVEGESWQVDDAQSASTEEKS